MSQQLLSWPTIPRKEFVFKKLWEIGTIDPRELTEPPENTLGMVTLPEFPNNLTPSQTCD
ncbi:hypothetical protein E2C01_067308 [Portunus trituberculatus]|uniref:Uncharacterized protein n=1 Tax=Portunus trituberculatus TaxID=210409 RepID=A0A5B7HNS0_PORTR|nr:hypothetical protein [Portunus trituberculatus]